MRDTRLFLGMGVRLRYLGFLKLDILNPLPPTSSIRYSWGIHLVRCMDFRSPESLHLATVRICLFRRSYEWPRLDKWL